MDHLYTEDNFENIEQYIKGQLQGDALRSFEERLANDKELQEMVEQHRAVMEGVAIAAYREDRDRLDAIHELMLEEEEVEEDTINIAPSTAKVFPLRRVTRVAAIWLVGLVMGMLIFQLMKGTVDQRMPIVDNTDYNFGEYGGVPDGLPIYEASVPVRIWQQDANKEMKELQERSIDLLIFDQEGEGIQYHMEGTNLYLIMNTDKVERWDAPDIEVSLQEWEKGQVALLRINTLIQQIPLENENFQQLLSQ